jgi:type II pantothenate kinase
LGTFTGRKGDLSFLERCYLLFGGRRDYNKIGLKATTIASSFGKVFKMSSEERTQLKEEDISRSLLYLVSNNIGQIAYLNAQAHGLTRIYFSGFFIRGHPATMNTINYAIHFWSKGTIRALFLRHEGYLGAVGAFLSQRPAQNRRLVSFQESFITAQKISPLSISAVGVLNEAPSSLTPFPLLANAEEYNPNTLRLTDASSQHYWIDLLDRNLEKLTHLAIEWEKGRSEDAVQRANAFKDMYRQHLQQLRREPNSYGPFSVPA